MTFFRLSKFIQDLTDMVASFQVLACGKSERQKKEWIGKVRRKKKLELPSQYESNLENLKA